MIEPNPENANLLDGEAIFDFLDMLVEDVDDDEAYVALRGLGEKGTEQEGVFRETFWIRANDPDLPNKVYKHCQRWAQHYIAAFVIPAIMKDQGGGESDIIGFPCIVLDLDSGDTQAKMDMAEQAIGPATLIVESSPGKLHGYWKLSELETDVKAIMDARKRLAQMCGGDEAFGRGPQPIRIPGSSHTKNYESNRCRIITQRSDAVVHFMDVQNATGTMPCEQEPQSAEILDFSNAPTSTHQPVSETLISPVTEGEEGPNNRFTSFSQVAGYWLMLWDQRQISREEALGRTRGWVLANMTPPWPEERIVREFSALAQKHELQRSEAAAIPTVSNTATGLKSWAITNWTQGEPPARRFLVEGLVQAGIPMMLVAEGGAGKSFAMLDLALAISSYRPEVTWMGQRLTPECAHGSVVMITAEDDKDELHIRIHSLDPQGRRHEAAERLIVLPLINMGGSFPLVQHDSRGNPEPSPKFATLLDHLKGVDNLKLVIIDTLNSTLHGEEISAAVIQDWFRVAAGPICGELGATLLVTHHIRKGEAIKNAEEMRAAVRGNTAIMNSVRCGIGIWHAHDYPKRMRKMNEEPERGRCYHLAVIKANNPELTSQTHTLLRQDNGMLADVTHRDSLGKASSGVDTSDSRLAWLVRAIQMGAEAGHPFTKTGANGVYERRGELPPDVRIAKQALHDMVEELKDAGLLVVASRAGSQTKGFLDAPDGPFAKATADAELAPGAWDAPNWGDYYYDEDTRSIQLIPL